MRAKKAKKALSEFSPEEIAKYRQAFIKNTIRRASYRWPWRNIAAQKARVGRGIYQCASCSQPVPNKFKKMDHVTPVVDPYVGFIGWDTYLDRIFVDEKGWQVLCKTCHDQKTAGEQAVRKEQRRLKKEGK